MTTELTYEGLLEHYLKDSDGYELMKDGTYTKNDINVPLKDRIILSPQQVFQAIQVDLRSKEQACFKYSKLHLQFSTAAKKILRND